MPKSARPQWQDLSNQVFTNIEDWRSHHPTATLRDIELALDEHLAPLRAQMLNDLALSSALRDIAALPAAQRPTCPHCQQPLEAQGQGQRTLTTKHEQTITLERSYATCPHCGQGFFPPR
jgi:hypothetical protein